MKGVGPFAGSQHVVVRLRTFPVWFTPPGRTGPTFTPCFDSPTRSRTLYGPLFQQPQFTRTPRRKFKEKQCLAFTAPPLAWCSLHS